MAWFDFRDCFLFIKITHSIEGVECLRDDLLDSHSQLIQIIQHLEKVYAILDEIVVNGQIVDCGPARYTVLPTILDRCSNG